MSRAREPLRLGRVGTGWIYLSDGRRTIIGMYPGAPNPRWTLDDGAGVATVDEDAVQTDGLVHAVAFAAGSRG